MEKNGDKLRKIEKNREKQGKIKGKSRENRGKNREIGKIGKSREK